MADSVKIRIEGDDAAFESSLKQAEASAKQAAAALSAEYKKAGMDMSSAMQKAWSEVKAAQQSGSTVMISGVETTIRKNTELANSIKTVGGNGYAPLAESANQASRSITDGLDKAERKTSSFATGLQKAGSVAKAAIQGITVAVTAISGAASVAGVAVLRTGSDFTASMSEVQAISGATAEEFALLEQTAKDFGASTSFSASEAADALKYMALAGWDAQKSVDALPGVLNLAAASGMELGAASDMVTDYLSAFGMEASQAGYFSDLLAHAQSKSNTTAAALGEAYRNCAANLSAAGQDVETVTSALMGMANQGLKGSAAGTALAAMMRDIGNKMQDGAISIGETSVAVKDAQGNYRDLTDILTDVSAAVQGMGTAERTAALSSTFTADSMRAVNLLLNEGVDKVASYEEGLRGATGAAEEMADTMLDNLQGDITIFKSALEGLQISAFEGMESPARSAVQMATEIVNGMNSAYKQGGIDGLVNNISAQIPKLMTVGVQAASKMFSGIAKSLPGLVKNLFSALPSMLGSIVDLVPQLSDSLLTLASSAIEQLIAQLPSLAPMLIGGIGKLFASAAKGLNSLLDGVSNGIWTAMGDLGMRDLTLQEAWQKQIDGLDVDKVHDLGQGLLTYSFDTEIDPGDYQAEIDAAVQTIHDALQNIPGLDESQRAAIEEAILKGSGADALEAAFEALEIPDAAGVAEQITTAMNTITGALDSTGLSEEAQQRALEIYAAGGDVKQALIDMGVDPAVAEDAAGKIEGAYGSIKGALDDYDIDAATFLTNATTDKGQIKAALEALGLDDVNIDSILSSIDTVSGKLSAMYRDLFKDIGDALTNGIDDANDADLDAAKQALENYIQDAHDKLVEWRDAKLRELEENNLTGEALATETANIQQTFDELSGNLNSIGEQANQFIADNAGKATSTVRENLGQLEEIANQAQTLNAQIDSMTAGALSTGQNLNRKAVEQGLVGDEQGQLEAINYTAQELQSALDKANQEAAAALEQAETEFAGDTEGYAARREEIMGQLSEKEGAAYDTYSQHMARIVAGILQNNPELEQALAQFSQQNEFAGMAQKLQQGITDAIDKGEPIDASQLIQSLGFSDLDLSNLAEELNLEPGQLMDSINYALQNGFNHGGDTPQFMVDLRDYINQNMEGFDLADAIGPDGIDVSSLNTVLAAAMEAGLIPEEMFPEGLSGDLSAYIVGILSTLDFDENRHVITPLLNIEPEPVPSPDTSENVANAVEEAASDTGEPATAEPEIDVEPDVQPADNTEEKIQEAIEGGEGATRVDATANVTVTPGEVTTGEDNSLQEAAQAQLEVQSMNVDVNASVNLNVSVSSSNGSAIGQQAGAEISSGIAAGISSGTGEAQSAAGSVAAAAAARANSAALTARQAGLNFSSGLAAGIRAGQSSVVSAAQAVAQAAAAAARNALQISSPSKVTRALGEFFSSGLAHGISDSAPLVSDAAARIANDAVTSLNGIIGPGNFAPRFSADSLSGTLSSAVQDFAAYEAERPVKLYVNGREMGRVMDADNSIAINARNRRIAVGYGK